MSNSPEKLEKVSHSEAETFLSCRRKHFYGYQKSGGLIPKNVAKGLARGSFVHEILEAYYNVILDAGDTKKAQRAARAEALVAARAHYDAAILAQEYDDENLQAGRRSVREMLFDFYFAHEPLVSNGWLIQAVELKVSLEIEVDEGVAMQYPFVIDIIAQDPKGKTVVIDHKCVYDFYGDMDADLLTQLPKYLAGLRAGGYPADYAAYNMIRNRSKKDAQPEDVLMFYPVRPTPYTVQDVLLEQLTVANDIIAARSHDEVTASRLAYRSASTITCRNCDFSDLCRSERVGSDITAQLAMDYTAKDPDKLFTADLTIN